MQYRRATLDDVPALARMGHNFVQKLSVAVPTTDEELRGAITALLSSPDSFGCIAEIDGTAVAMLLGLETAVWFSPVTRIAVELAWWTEPAHRGTAGVRLLKRFEAWARERGVQHFVMSDFVVQDSPPAGPLLERCGYRMTERAFMKLGD